MKQPIQPLRDVRGSEVPTKPRPSGSGPEVPARSLRDGSLASRLLTTCLHALLLTLLSGSLMAWQDTPEAHLGRGYDALKLERYEEAVTEFRAALRLDPKLVMRARFPLAVALFEMKNSAAARPEFEAVRRELGDHPNLLYY